MEMIVDFPGGARVDTHFGEFTVKTDQPPQGGGQGSAPTPFAVFLASIGACAGIYVLGFCKQRGLSTEGIRIVQRMHASPLSQGLVQRVELEIQVPPEFPEKYHEALIRSADQCLVKRHFEKPPEFDIHTQVMASA
ncbi:MAG: osmotically inducible protein OsmC [Gammaproteobacteria bacterium]|nr:osmotically inducible protein OsmC [Gammaproteobacteria bacterium]